HPRAPRLSPTRGPGAALARGADRRRDGGRHRRTDESHVRDARVRGPRADQRIHRLGDGAHGRALIATRHPEIHSAVVLVRVVERTSWRSPESPSVTVVLTAGRSASRSSKTFSASLPTSWKPQPTS